MSENSNIESSGPTRDPDERVPVQLCEVQYDRGPSTVARKYAEAAYVEYEHRYGNEQSLDRLHERGGFSVEEIMGLLCDRITRLEGEVAKRIPLPGQKVCR